MLTLISYMLCNNFNSYWFIVNQFTTLRKESCIIYLITRIWNVSSSCNPNVLINLISRRVRQLSSGGNRPLIMETAGLSTAEIALTEIIEGKMEWETDLPKPKRKSRRRARKA